MTKSVEVQKVVRFLLQQEKYFSKPELAFAKTLLKWLPYDQQFVDCEEFFRHLRNKKMTAHKQHAAFALDIFKVCGVSYRKIMHMN